jgi:hypothetical protein
VTGDELRDRAVLVFSTGFATSFPVQLLSRKASELLANRGGPSHRP